MKAEVIDYVLRRPPAAERVEIEKSIEQACQGLDLLIAGEMERATMKINARPPRPKPPRPEKVPAAAGVGPAGGPPSGTAPADAATAATAGSTTRDPRGESR